MFRTRKNYHVAANKAKTSPGETMFPIDVKPFCTPFAAEYKHNHLQGSNLNNNQGISLPACL